MLQLSDEDYGVWYVDVMDNPDRYQGKVVSFLGQVAQSDKFPGAPSACGRFAMVCCAEDTTFLGVLLRGPEVKNLQTRDWVQVTGRVQLENVKLYQGEGPVLHILDIAKAQPPRTSWSISENHFQNCRSCCGNFCFLRHFAQNQENHLSKN